MNKNVKIEDDVISKERLRLWLRLLRISRVMERELKERLRLESDSTMPRFDVMAALYRFPQGLTMQSLAGELKVSGGNVTVVVDKLVEQGLIARAQKSDDKRTFIVSLTEQGRQEFEKLAALHESWVNTLFSDVSYEHALNLHHELDAILDSIENSET